MMTSESYYRHIRVEEVSIACSDGVSLGGHVWHGDAPGPHGCVIINNATGVLAKYYHRYARFLAERGFDVLTYDYRGIGASRPANLAACKFRWRDWGALDFEAAIHFMRRRFPGTPIKVVGHSVGGYLPGLAPSAAQLDRMLTVGAQYAWFGDYARNHRVAMFLKWHVIMPLLTAIVGYFPGKRLGWLEDLPAGVAYEWSFRRPRFEVAYDIAERSEVLSRIGSVTAPILALSMSDDEFGTPEAIGRTLSYYKNAKRTLVCLNPKDVGQEKVGHFNLFHDSHSSGFWLDTLVWLRGGVNPWPNKIVGVSREGA
ncbi:alpha/beta fold hydrolase [Breoghania sp.]|uniref:alpha/beta hydrolase family protein n=1 Tax=Breoghania sp. TaxID=2065378 RepID=UPI0029CA8D4D|nr:alpha/beta fold hydrolase [Breoghania sp.]